MSLWTWGQNASSPPKETTKKIAVEIKSFHGASDVRDLEMALGQYVFYRSLLARFEPGRKLFLAVPYSIFVSTRDEPIARPVLADLAVACLAFDPRQEVIVTWTTCIAISPSRL